MKSKILLFLLTFTYSFAEKPKIVSTESNEKKGHSVQEIQNASREICKLEILLPKEQEPAKDVAKTTDAVTLKELVQLWYSSETESNFQIFKIKHNLKLHRIERHINPRYSGLGHLACFDVTLKKQYIGDGFMINLILNNIVSSNRKEYLMNRRELRVANIKLVVDECEEATLVGKWKGTLPFGSLPPSPQSIIKGKMGYPVSHGEEIIIRNNKLMRKRMHAVYGSVSRPNFPYEFEFENGKVCIVTLN